MKFLAALTTVLMLAVYLAATGLPTKVTYVPHDKVSATMTKGGAIIEDGGLRVTQAIVPEPPTTAAPVVGENGRCGRASTRFVAVTRSLGRLAVAYELASQPTGAGGCRPICRERLR